MGFAKLAATPLLLPAMLQEAPLLELVINIFVHHYVIGNISNKFVVTAGVGVPAVIVACNAALGKKLSFFLLILFLSSGSMAMSHSVQI